jgi:ESCRT-I complex subunit VPS28
MAQEEQKEEVKPISNAARVYAVIKKATALDQLYLDQYVRPSAYIVSKKAELIDQMTIACQLAGIVDLAKFEARYRLLVPKWLKDANTSAAAAAAAEASSAVSSHKEVFETTQTFITLMDTLKLGMTAMDELVSLFTTLLNTLPKLRWTHAIEGVAKLQDWFEKIKTRKADETLKPEEVRQLLMDLEIAYNSFYAAL